MSDHEPLYIDNSTLKATAACSTLDVTRYILGFVTGEERATLRSGTAFHEAVACHFQGGTHDEAMDVLANGIVCVACEGQGRNITTGQPCQTCGGSCRISEGYQGFADEHVPTTDRLAWGNVSRIIDYWLQVHPLNVLPFRVDPKMVEIGFAFPLTDDGDIVFCGRIDALATYQGGLYVVENKSTGRISRDWLSQFKLDSQNSGYLWAAQQHAQQPVVGTFLNAVEFSKLPSSEKRCERHAVPYIECGHLHATFEMPVVTRSPELLEEWKKTAIYWAKKHRDLMTRFPELKDIHRVRMQGMFNGACRFCALQEWCAGARQLDYAVNNFTFEPWTPYERVGQDVRQHTALKP